MDGGSKSGDLFYINILFLVLHIHNDPALMIPLLMNIILSGISLLPNPSLSNDEYNLESLEISFVVVYE